MSAALEPLALSRRDAATFFSISKRCLSRLIAARKIEARKEGPRTLADVASLKAHYASLPKRPIMPNRVRPARSYVSALASA